MLTRGMCDAYCFSTAITVTRTLLSVAFMLHCLSCWTYKKVAKLEMHQQGCVITADAANLSLPLPHSLQRTMVSQFAFDALRTKHNIFGRCRGFACSVCGFSALHILVFWISLYPLKQRHVSSVKQKLSNIQITFCKKKYIYFRLQSYRSTGSQQKLSKAVKLCWATRRMLKVSIAGRGQILVYMFEYLQMSGLWVAAYTVNPGFLMWRELWI